MLPAFAHCQLLAPGARAWAPVAGVRGHPVAGVRLHPVGPAGCVFGSCSSVVARCCCSRLTGRKSRPLPYVLALRASQRWTKRGPNVDPTWTQTKQKVGKSCYSIFLLFLPLSLSLSLSLAVASWRLSAPTAAHFQQKGVQPNTYCVVR